MSQGDESGLAWDPARTRRSCTTRRRVRRRGPLAAIGGSTPSPGTPHGSSREEKVKGDLLAATVGSATGRTSSRPRPSGDGPRSSALHERRGKARNLDHDPHCVISVEVKQLDLRRGGKRPVTPRRPLRRSTHASSSRRLWMARGREPRALRWRRWCADGRTTSIRRLRGDPDDRARFPDLDRHPDEVAIRIVVSEQGDVRHRLAPAVGNVGRSTRRCGCSVRCPWHREPGRHTRGLPATG